uniref:PPIase cyclophilin-type domain-containing protein n=1 Tax=Eutreptiella gymnastica TaxID=73025 RepID=A0A7S1I749_9EUGL|mmetsp:Transcript_134446/g.233304  ORF Transcript_134446/g.233304 Transcript_134446/m.233304 type:complete len:310 (+) Transcript_134446:100-1029(+)
MSAAKQQSLILAGRIDDENYQKSFECVEFLRDDRPNEYKFTVMEMVPVQWEAHLTKLREHFGIEKISSVTACIVYTEDMTQCWCGAEFAMHITSITKFKLFDYPDDSTDPEAYKNQAKIRYNQFLRKTGHNFCFFKLSIDGELLDEQVVFELFTDVCPRTCENFRHLCIGDCADAHGPNNKSIKLHYKGTSFYRIVKEGWIQGGDIINDRGNAGHSIYGPVFPDESFSIKHETEGVLGFANSGKDTNGSQFYITMGRNSWMDGKYVAFGRVIEGISVIHRIHLLETRHNQMPTVAVKIEDCGEIDLTKF